MSSNFSSDPQLPSDSTQQTTPSISASNLESSNNTQQSVQQTSTSSEQASNQQWDNVATELLLDILLKTYDILYSCATGAQQYVNWKRIFVLFKDYLVEHRHSTQVDLARFADELTLDAMRMKWESMRNNYIDIVYEVDSTESGSTSMDYFDKVGAILENDPEVHPKIVIQSMRRDNTPGVQIDKRTEMPFDIANVKYPDDIVELNRRIQEEILDIVEQERLEEERRRRHKRPRRRQQQQTFFQQSTEQQEPSHMGAFTSEAATEDRINEFIDEMVRSDAMMMNQLLDLMKSQQAYLERKRKQDERRNRKMMRFIEREKRKYKALTRLMLRSLEDHDIANYILEEGSDESIDKE